MNNFYTFVGMPKLLAILVLWILVFSANAQDLRRFTIWNKNQVSVEPWQKVTLQISEKIHYSSRQNNIEYTYGQCFVGHSPKPWLTYGGGLRVAFTDLGQSRWLNENRWMTFLNFTKEKNAFGFRFSNRFEYRTYKELSNYWRYKQAFKINFPNITSWGMRFYVSEESYFKINQNTGMHVARFYSGLTAVQSNNFALNLYYALEKSKVLNTWVAGDILGLNLNFSI